jgi:uncharacterized protein YndB with AHSA1/START domain
MTTTSTSTSTPTTPTTTQVYRVYIKATAEAIWEAITDSEWTTRYGYGFTGPTEYDLRPGGALRFVPTEKFKADATAQGFAPPDVLIDGEVIEVDPPHKLVTTWRMLMDAGCAAEGFTRITYEIKPYEDGSCSLTLTHELDGAPHVASLVSGQAHDRGEGGGGGHAWVLSDLKSLLETGTTLSGS